MATLVPEYSWEDLDKVKQLGRLKELHSGEVYEDGEYIFTFANGNLEPSGYQRSLAEYNAQVSNSVGGKTLQEILGETTEETEHEAPLYVSDKPPKPRKQRRKKLATV